MKTIIAVLIVLLAVSTALADRYVYTDTVNTYIPEGDSAGVRDTINIPDHIQIEDINFYVGVGTPDQPWGESILIDVFSPTRARVRLNDWGRPTFYFYDVWYDTDREEDGPGHLEDYDGGDAYGPWEMFCFDPFQGQSLTWYTWSIEVIGNSTNANDQTHSGLPHDYAINGIYPNPFNAQTTISYALPQAGRVTISVYNLLGQKVSTLFNGIGQPGEHQVIWNASDFPSGIYFARLEAGDKSRNIKMVLLK